MHIAEQNLNLCKIALNSLEQLEPNENDINKEELESTIIQIKTWVICLEQKTKSYSSIKNLNSKFGEIPESEDG